MKKILFTLLIILASQSHAGKMATKVLGEIKSFKGSRATLTDAECPYSITMLSGFYTDKDGREKLLCWTTYKDRVLVVDPLSDTFYDVGDIIKTPDTNKRIDMSKYI